MSPSDLASRIGPRPSKRQSLDSDPSTTKPLKSPRLSGDHLDTSMNNNPTPNGPKHRFWGGQSSQSSRGNRGFSNNKSGGPRGRGRGAGPSNRVAKNVRAPPADTLSEPLLDEAYIKEKYARTKTDVPGVAKGFMSNPKSALSNHMNRFLQSSPKYSAVQGILRGKHIHRANVPVDGEFVGMGDGDNRKEAERNAALHGYYELLERGLVRKPEPKKGADAGQNGPSPTSLSDGTTVTVDLARQFMDYYCRKYKFGRPFIRLDQQSSGRGKQQAWEAAMTVGGSRIGLGSAVNKKMATQNCYLDVVRYLEGCDPSLWKSFQDASKKGKDLGDGPSVHLVMSEALEDVIRDLNRDMSRSVLYSNAPEHKLAAGSSNGQDPQSSRPWRGPRAQELKEKSAALLKRRKEYLEDPTMAKMRETRQTLPVYTKAVEVLKHIDENEITIVMAATGSGKTTQIPQLVLDAFIDREDGARCNIVCTQPRRLAAISVAQRIAKERNEPVGKNGSIGYHVRFEANPPADNGSVTFCTIGIFLRRMQMALQRGHDKLIDSLTHIIVDEVHERDIDTDLLLVVLKRLIEEKRAKRQPMKVILMSATIDATLFQNYFPDANGKPASVIEIPGRSYPVQKHFLEDFLEPLLRDPRHGWVFSDEAVAKYICRETPHFARALPSSEALRRYFSQEEKGGRKEDELEIPYPLVALTVSHVLQTSDSGHVLVFLPGWEEIQKVQQLIEDPSSRWGVSFSDRSKYHVHVLHSTIPLSDQQVIFEPPPEGVRRIILSTNIAETSVTIPDVVFVVDTAKIKENRYDPEKHISALVSAWVGTSNLNQRAGRAGRHRPGEYYGILGKNRMNALHSHQTVEMKRMDLSNVVMHVKALDFPGMEVEEVLARTIEPPAPERVEAAMAGLKMVGALDDHQNLTSLGRVLLKLPIDVQLGRLVLYGSFFKCLDQALTLAAIISNRDPFLCPPLMKKEAQAAKDNWCTEDFRSDILAALQAFNKWNEFEKRGDHRGASRFCGENFLSKATLLLVAKVKQSLLESLVSSGVLDISAGGAGGRMNDLPPELNENGNSLPLLAALIAIASQPKFAIRTTQMTYRTAQDKTTFIHPSSVNHTKRVGEDPGPRREKQIFAFWEKRQNLSMAGSGPGQMYLVGCTRLDPMTYVLFGAYNLTSSSGGLRCDDWLPLYGSYDALDYIRSLKVLMESCMLRVFEGINSMDGVQRRRQQQTPSVAPGKYVPPYRRQNRDNAEDESGDEDDGQGKRNKGNLTKDEIKELDRFTHDIVRILDQYADERRSTQSRWNSRPATPVITPNMASRALPGLDPGWRSGSSTPLRYESRPSSRLGLRPYDMNP